MRGTKTSSKCPTKTEREAAAKTRAVYESDARLEKHKATNRKPGNWQTNNTHSHLKASSGYLLRAT